MIKLSHHQGRRPLVLVHGGAGPTPPCREIHHQRRAALGEVMAEAWKRAAGGAEALDTVCFIVRWLEACPLFNAGYGAVVQSDGVARLSASLMDGRKQKFSGVHLATQMVHPSQLAWVLQARQESVLGPYGAQLLAREVGMAPACPVTAERARQWLQRLAQEEQAQGRHGTVGAVVLDSHNALAAATSTGGNRINYPERISDSATVAGNYATAFAAVSCTGIGEEIVDDGLAVRLETRVRDGKNMIEASELAFQEAARCSRHYGWIGADTNGNWAMYSTTEVLYCMARWGSGEEAGGD